MMAQQFNPKRVANFRLRQHPVRALMVQVGEHDYCASALALENAKLIDMTMITADSLVQAKRQMMDWLDTEFPAAAEVDG